MRGKFKFLSIILAILICFSFGGYKNVYANEEIYLGGMPAGFRLSTRGAEVIGVCDVVCENGLVSPLKAIGITEGDVIYKINNYEINSALDIQNALKNNENAIIEYNHAGQTIIKQIKAVKDINGNYKLGVYIRDGVSGIGTITYIKGNKFASLGHPVIDNNGSVLEISGGKLYNCSISGYIKGLRGRAGELKGAFLRNNAIANIDKNLESGVYGNLTDNFDTSNLTRVELGTAKMGEAYIYSTIDGNVPKKYEISIVKVDDYGNKNLVIKINDEELISKTGGIVQGMSGSPIVQNNKLVGAITHVFINDPTRGFGIKIENMINNWYILTI